jgi:para-nitrobenzyl esterase
MMKSYLQGALITALILGGGFCQGGEAANFQDKVKTEQGVVTGAYDARHQVVEWLGVPYAAPATGANRWRAPQPAAKHKAALECTQAAPMNIQTKAGKVLGEEGVLTLDIVRPDTTERKLPVMVFIHGGNNQTSSSRLWVGNKFAQEANVVYVSVQYRLGMLGFNNLPALQKGSAYEESGNYGLLDQAAALEWVKKNIKAFGGDEKNITLSGFSAGGRDALAMLISPAFKGKFSKMISFSGGLTVADPALSQKTLARRLAPLVVEDGRADDVVSAEKWLLSADGNEEKAVRNYLQNVKAERLAPIMAGAVIRMSAFPHLYADGKLVPKEGFATKKVNSVPLLLLASSDEFSSFAARDVYFKDRLQQINEDELTTKEFRFANKYGSLLYGLFNGQEAAERLYPHYKKDIYVCKFDFAHGNEVVGEAYRTRNGAFHGVFMPFISDQPNPFTKNTYAFTAPGAQELSKVFISSLANFMRTGNPNTVLLGNTWSRWNPEYRPEMVFDANRQQARIYSINSRVSYDGILAELEADHSLPDESREYIIKNVLNGRWFSEGLDAKYGNASLWAE